jgi:hypothetical protein
MDQVDGVDRSRYVGEVIVNSQPLGNKTKLAEYLPDTNPDLISGELRQSKSGVVEELSAHIEGKDDQEARLFFERTSDGAALYSVSTPTGHTTVRHNADNTLFIIEGSLETKYDDIHAMSSPDFTALYGPQSQAHGG